MGMTFSRLDEEELIQLLREANREELVPEVEIDVEALNFEENIGVDNLHAVLNVDQEQVNEQEMNFEALNVAQEIFNEQGREVEALNVEENIGGDNAHEVINVSQNESVATRRRSRPTHPPSAEMVMMALTALKKRKGCTVSQIHEYIEAHYTVSLNRVRNHIENFLAREAMHGKLDIVDRNGERAFIINKKPKISKNENTSSKAGNTSSKKTVASKKSSKPGNKSSDTTSRRIVKKRK